MKARLISAVLIFLVFFCALHASDMVPYRKSRYINDYAGVINDKNARDIMLLLKKFEQKTGIESSVLTIGRAADYSAGKEGIDMLASQALAEWRLEDSGILLVVAVSDRRLKIELGRLVDETGWDKSREIIDNTIIPYFKSGDYSTGIYEGAKAMTVAFKPSVKSQKPDMLIYFLLGGALLFFAAAGISFAVSKAKKPKQNFTAQPKTGRKGYGGGAVGSW